MNGTVLAKKKESTQTSFDFTPKRKGLNLKEILLVGNDREESTVLKHLQNSSKFKIKRARTFKKAEKIIASLNPDFVLCAGKINIDEEGNYVLEID